MAERLTPQQQMAVNDRGGKLLVSAAAGSGKTKVLVDRLMKYIQDPVAPANIDDFLLITYTKAAAAELRGKIASKLSEHIAADPNNRHLQRQLQRLYLTKISTVHAFCADILREYAYKLDIFSDFRVADENECTQLRGRAMEMILEEAYDSVDSDQDFQSFVDTQGLGRNDALVPEIIEKVYDSARCHLDPAGWCNGCIQNAGTQGISDPSQTVWGKSLIDDVYACLDMQISAMERCTAAVSAMDGMEKPLSLLSNTVLQLQLLRQSNSWEEIVNRKAIDYGRLVFPKKYDDPSITEPVKAIRKACKETLEKKLRVFSDSAAQVLADLEQSAAAARGLMSLVARFGDAYSRLKRGRRILDFSDLEHKTLDLLYGKGRTGHTAAAQEIGERFREIMVDEYQDSNGVQDAIFAALTTKRQNLFMVGDVKQSIYQFRLADPGIFLDKYASYVPAEEAEIGQGRKIQLSSNFRSGGGVIDAVNFVFENCMTETVGGIRYDEEESLREGIPHVDITESEVELHCIQVQEETYAEEAAFVAERIESLLDGSHYVRDGDTLRTITADDIVILLRSPGSVGMEFQNALEQRGIRCSSGTGTDLLLTEEVGTMRSILQIISNPRQDIPLLAVLASPVFNFSADELASVRGDDLKCSMFDALCKSGEAHCGSFLEVLQVLRKSASMDTLPELLERIWNLTRLDTIYAAMPGGGLRKRNLQTFYQLAVDFSAMGSGNLDRFLEHLEAIDEKGLVAAEQTLGGSVTIMSIHKSKGLEFPVVFLCGLSRRFNQENLHAQVLCHKELGLGLSCVDSRNRVRYPTISKAAIAAKLESDGLSEEMRVLYVAMTRARDRLIMIYASQNLEKDLKDIVLRSGLSEQELMTRYVSCPGQWILYAALKRMEAGPLFALGGKVGEAGMYGRPWDIAVHEVQISDTEAFSNIEEPQQLLPDISVEKLRQLLSFRYNHMAATQTPSKQTATQRKGRIKDQEVSENAQEHYPSRTWRKPSFLDCEGTSKEYGSAMHAVLQYIRYEACSDTERVVAELTRLVAEGYITDEQAKLVDAGGIARFFSTDIGKKLRSSNNVLREFKFSILDDAAQYGEGLAGESVLLQGVVDCALVEPDGITIIDFKTDKVTQETVESVAMDYRAQVETYSDAMCRIYELPVKAKGLYFFRINSFCWL